jgi:two-component system phosphate regulon response regulator PhoB
VDASQGEGVGVTDRSVDVHMVSLRRKLGDLAHLIETVRGVGYRFQEI